MTFDMSKVTLLFLILYHTCQICFLDVEMGLRSPSTLLGISGTQIFMWVSIWCNDILLLLVGRKYGGQLKIPFPITISTNKKGQNKVEYICSFDFICWNKILTTYISTHLNVHVFLNMMNLEGLLWFNEPLS